MPPDHFNISSNGVEIRQNWPAEASQSQKLIPGFIARWSMWQYVVTFLLGVIVYDQGEEQC